MVTSSSMFDRPAYYRAKRDAQRERAKSYLGGTCVECGTTENLHFHHTDPTTMSFRISTWLLLSWERLVVELDKCELRCREHHTDEHRSMAPCGTVQRYWAGCRCKPCAAAMSAYNATARSMSRGATNSSRTHKPIVHGTRNGYQMERRRGMTPCDDCKAANAAYKARFT